MHTIRYLILWLIIALAPLTHSLAANDPESIPQIRLVAWDNYRQSLGTVEPVLSVDSMLAQLTVNADAEQSKIKKLSLNDLLRQVVAQNQRIKAQKTDWKITEAEEEKTHAIFEPDFIASIKLEDNSQNNTVEEAISQQATSFSERNWDFSLGVEGFALTGAEYNVGYSMRKLSNSLISSGTGEDNQYQMFLGVSLTQPLLKNAGSRTTTTGIRAAEAESEASFQEYRQQMMQTAKKAAITYWEFYQAHEKLELRQGSIRIADKILDDNRARYRTGKMAEVEVFEAKSGLLKRKSLMSLAMQRYYENSNRLRTLLSIEASAEKLDVKATDPPPFDPAVLNKDAILQRAFKGYPKYQEIRAKLEQSDIKVAFAQNQLLPELDLVASYGLNGVDFDRSDSWQQVREAEYDSWSVGIDFRLPLQGGIDSRAELRKVELEKKLQLISLKDLEINLANDVDTAIHNIYSAIEQLGFAEEVVVIRKKLVNAELARLESGKSNSRLVLQKEDDHRNALEFALDNQVELQTALIELEMLEGSILLNHGVNLMEGRP